MGFKGSQFCLWTILESEDSYSSSTRAFKSEDGCTPVLIGEVVVVHVRFRNSSSCVPTLFRCRNSGNNKEIGDTGWYRTLAIEVVNLDRYISVSDLHFY